MCDEFAALGTPKVLFVCESGEGSGGRRVEAREIAPASEPERLHVKVAVGAMNVSGGVTLVTFVLAVLGAALIVVASFA